VKCVDQAQKKRKKHRQRHIKHLVSSSFFWQKLIHFEVISGGFQNQSETPWQVAGKRLCYLKWFEKKGTLRRASTKSIKFEKMSKNTKDRDCSGFEIFRNV
jgi:hypothetical protein